MSISEIIKRDQQKQETTIYFFLARVLMMKNYCKEQQYLASLVFRRKELHQN